MGYISEKPELVDTNYRRYRGAGVYENNITRSIYPPEHAMCGLRWIQNELIYVKIDVELKINQCPSIFLQTNVRMVVPVGMVYPLSPVFVWRVSVATSARMTSMSVRLSLVNTGQHAMIMSIPISVDVSQDSVASIVRETTMIVLQGEIHGTVEVKCGWMFLQKKRTYCVNL